MPPSHAKRTPPRLLEVVAAETVTPHLRRIRLGGAALEGFPQGRDAAHIKVFLPRAGQREPVLPTLGPRGPVWPPREQRPITRTYSVRRFDAAAGHLEVDFVLHGDNGPASRWAQHARPGDRIGIAGPGGPAPMLARADWYLLAGDLSALPAIAALLESLPADAAGRAIVEVPDGDDRHTLARAADIPVTWLVTGDAVPGVQLADAVCALQWPPGRCFAWLAGESTAVVTMRDHLRRRHGFDRRSMYAIPYWKASLTEEAYHEERHRIMDELDEQ